jgi:xanthine dehydrogenase accessory factor
MKAGVVGELLKARKERRAVALITDVGTGAQRFVSRDQTRDDALASILDDAFRYDKSQMHEGHFIHIHNPPLRLIIVGAVHIAQSVIPMAEAAGYQVTVIDPRGAFATGARFPHIDLKVEWPDEVLPALGLDARTALLALTHDPKIDDVALTLALASDCFYIGALGSKKNQAARLERLKAKSIGDDALHRIHGPIGLAIGAQGAPEIAISIMAEMTRALRLGA